MFCNTQLFGVWPRLSACRAYIAEPTGDGLPLFIGQPERIAGSTHSWSDRNKSGYDATVRICKDCNTKILNNRIEKPFQVNLKAMVEGDAVALDSDAVTRMATWAAKTVMTRELLDKGMGDLSIPEWQYRWLHDYVSPPQTMLMYFGKAEYAPDKWDRHRRFRAVVDGEHLGGDRRLHHVVRHRALLVHRGWFRR